MAGNKGEENSSEPNKNISRYICVQLRQKQT